MKKHEYIHVRVDPELKQQMQMLNVKDSINMQQRINNFFQKYVDWRKKNPPKSRAKKTQRG